MEFEEEKFFKELYIIHRMFATRLFLNLRLLSTLVVCIPLVDCLVNKYGYYVYMRLLYLFFCFSRINVYSHRHFRIAKIFFKISLIHNFSLFFNSLNRDGVSKELGNTLRLYTRSKVRLFQEKRPIKIYGKMGLFKSLNTTQDDTKRGKQKVNGESYTNYYRSYRAIIQNINTRYDFVEYFHTNATSYQQ